MTKHWSKNKMADYPRINSAYATQTSTMYMPIALKLFAMFYISFSVKIHVLSVRDLSVGSDRVVR